MKTDERKKKKILIAGAWVWPWYQEACATALEELGCLVERFSWFDDFYRWERTRVEPVFKTGWAALQNRLLMGPTLWRINRRLINTARKASLDVIWFYNCPLIFPKTLQTLRHFLPDALLIQYINDNPFSNHLWPDYWRYLKRSIPYFDLHFIYRQSDQVAFQKAGAKKTYLLRSYFIPKDDFRVPLEEVDQQYRSEVLFAGHYEDDGRLEKLEAIARSGFSLKIFGGGWVGAQKKMSTDSPLRFQFPITPVVGEKYRQAICGAKIALCFLSKINSDTYTRRNFQIAAMQTFMLSEYSVDLEGLFREGVEAEFFRSKAELIDKIRYYLKYEHKREQIARKGFERVLKDGHDVRSRMQTFLKRIQQEKPALPIPFSTLIQERSSLEYV